MGKSFLDRIDEELGLVRLCRGCDEEWPKDKEFWYMRPDGVNVASLCRACHSERQSKGSGFSRTFLTEEERTERDRARRQRYYESHRADWLRSQRARRVRRREQLAA